MVSAMPMLDQAMEGLKKFPSMVQSAVEPHVMNGVSALKGAVDEATPHVLNAIEASKPAVHAVGDAAAGAGNMVKQVAIAGKDQVGTIQNPLPFPIPGTARMVQGLTKDLINRGGEEAYAAIQAEFADDPAFAQLADAYTSAAKVALAERLVANFLMASKDPTPEEIGISLTATLDAFAKEQGSKAGSHAQGTRAGASVSASAGASVDVEDAAPVTMMVAKITGLLTLGLVGSKALTKPVVQSRDELAIISRFSSDFKFGRLVLNELELEAGKRAAARAVADNFLLASKTPTSGEIRMSLDATVGSLLKEKSLPAKPPVLSKPLLTKTKGPGATAAVLKLLGANPVFDELAHAHSAAAVEEFKKVRQPRACGRLSHGRAPFGAQLHPFTERSSTVVSRPLVPLSCLSRCAPAPGVQVLPWRVRRDEGGAQRSAEARRQLPAGRAGPDGRGGDDVAGNNNRRAHPPQVSERISSERIRVAWMTEPGWSPGCGWTDGARRAQRA